MQALRAPVAVPLTPSVVELPVVFDAEFPSVTEFELPCASLALWVPVELPRLVPAEPPELRLDDELELVPVELPTESP